MAVNDLSGRMNKKLSYRRGTARRAMLVNSSYTLQAMKLIKASNKKSDLQGHSRALAMVHMRFPISFPLVFHCNYVCIFQHLRNIITYFLNFIEVTWLWTHPFWGDISCMYSYSYVSISTQNLNCLVSPITTIWLRAKFKKKRATCSDHAPFICHHS